MKLVVVGVEPPEDVKSWSGIPHHLSRVLSERFDLVFVGGLHGASAVAHKIIARAHRSLGTSTYRVRSEPSVLRAFAKRLDEVIEKEQADAILSMGCEPLAYLNSSTPAYLIYDATFRQISEIYPHFQSLCERSRRTGEVAQQRGFMRANICLATSTWAKESAERDYGVPQTRLRVLPLCANLSDAPNPEQVEHRIRSRIENNPINFLFVGVEWERKGGDVAVSIVRSLVERGVKARLHIVGCTPPASFLAMPFIEHYGFLSKRDPDQAAKLDALFQSAAFFIMPSRADCSPCVFSEASAYGIPSISNTVGGIAESVVADVTGLLLSANTPYENLVDKLMKLCSQPNDYLRMARSARMDFEQRLNWGAYAKNLEAIMLENMSLLSPG